MPSTFRPLKRNCPICSGTRRDCRESTHTGLIHCRHDVTSVEEVCVKKLPPLPAAPVGQRFIKYFNHGWYYIKAPVPVPGATKNLCKVGQPPFEGSVTPNNRVGLRGCPTLHRLSLGERPHSVASKVAHPRGRYWTLLDSRQHRSLLVLNRYPNPRLSNNVMSSCNPSIALHISS